jgi:type VI secretion system protein ImpF
MKNKEVRPSLLDRLLDSSSGRPGAYYFSMHELRDSVQRDLQNLLNTRVRFVSPDKRLQDIQDTIVNYGLPDLTSQQLTSEQGKQEFAAWIERSIKRYEPRFKSVEVTALSRSDDSDGVTFRVDAVLYADPAPEDVSFDSVIDPLTQTISLSEARQ